ncbi:MAG: hypothetical protein OEQ13_00480 [Acidobacteriota bacterium]|nr:hypothetical protein [Acidobacteriota bacterium]
MRTLSVTLSLLFLASGLLAPPCLAGETWPPVGTPIPPVNRAETYLDVGAATVESLPPGTRVRVDRASGMSFTLEQRDGKLMFDLPAATLSEDKGTLITPLGFKIGSHDAMASTMTVESPNGRSTLIRRRGTRLLVYESDGGRWDVGRRLLKLRLQDGTRIDRLEEGGAWEAITLRGERFRLAVGPQGWSRLPSIPSPPLIPDETVLYLAGDGDDWRFPVGEDHAVFGWNWFPYGLTAKQILDPIRIGQRSLDVINTFLRFVTMPPPEELASYMIGRRLSLSGGDRMTIEAPGREAVTAYLMPGHFDPNFMLPIVQHPDSFRRPGASSTNR